MIFDIENVKVYFPYDKIYPEQYKYMLEVKRLLDNYGHSILEMPSGTGKTIALLSVCVSYHLQYGKKIIYCSRTVPEIQQALKELQNLIKFIKGHKECKFLGIGLASRKNLCINKNITDVETECRQITSEWNMKCPYFNDMVVDEGVYDLDDLKALGQEMGTCPYFLSRRMLAAADCIIYTYNYLIDPHIHDVISKELSSEAIVIFDEAHNIDNACIEALSFEIRRNTLDGASKCLKTIERRMKTQARKDLDIEDLKIKKETYTKKLGDAIDCIPFSYNGKKTNILPGNMRNAHHFLSFLRRLVEFFKAKLKTTHLTTESPGVFCKNIHETTLIDKKSLSYASHRFKSLERSLQLDYSDDLLSLKTVIDFATLASMHSKGFTIIFEPFDSQAPSVFNPILRLWCLDASIAIKPIFDKFRNVIITSGTLSPIDMYPKILGFAPVNTLQLSTTLERNNISPLIITKGNDQITMKTDETRFDDNELMTTAFNYRKEPAVVRNYGILLQELCKIVPDGIIVFFPSYIYMEEVVSLWCESKIINNFKKLVFIETPDSKETSEALKNYRRVVDTGRGAILLCVARGKISEGVDFKDQYGRCVVLIGVPFQYTESVRLKKRLEFLREYGIRESDFLNFDAMRHAAQCLGRVLRNKRDYGLMIMADSRFGRKEKKSKLPKWIQERLDDANNNLSIDMAMGIARRFYREMAQKLDDKSHAYWDSEDVEKASKELFVGD